MRIRNAQNMAESCHFFPAENAGNRRFSSFSFDFFLIILVLFLSDSHHQVGPFSTLLVLIFGTKVQNGNAQKMTESDFVKTFFLAENAGNMLGKPVFGHFLEIAPLVFSYFLLKDAY